MADINIDGTSYDIEAMTDTQKALVGQIGACIARDKELRSSLDIHTIAQKTYVDALKASLAEE